MKGWGRIEGGGGRKEGRRKGRRRRGEVSTDNKPVLICSPIRAIKLNGSAKRESGGPSGRLSDPHVLLRTLEERFYLKNAFNLPGIPLQKYSPTDI